MFISRVIWELFCVMMHKNWHCICEISPEINFSVFSKNIMIGLPVLMRWHRPISPYSSSQAHLLTLEIMQEMTKNFLSCGKERLSWSGTPGWEKQHSDLASHTRSATTQQGRQSRPITYWPPTWQQNAAQVGSFLPWITWETLWTTSVSPTPPARQTNWEPHQ